MQHVTQRYKMSLAYMGTRYRGWQRQSPDRNDNSIQAVLENALFDISKGNIRVFGSSRTDAGVHALNTTAHFDLNRINRHTGDPIEPYEPEILRKMLNFHLRNQDISVTRMRQVPLTYHARFNAKMRQYLYRIFEIFDETDSAYKHPLLANRVWFVNAQEGKKMLQLDLMREAASHLVGIDIDMSSFAKRSQRIKEMTNSDNLIRKIHSIEFEEIENWDMEPYNPFRFSKYYREIRVHFGAPSFLHNQIRILVNLFVRVGRGEIDPNMMPVIIEKQSRYYTDKIAPPDGLYLVDVFDEYDDT